MNNGGLSVLIGNRSTGDGYTEHDTTYGGSTVGSLNGNVTLSAGNDVHITGSDVLSQTGTTIVGKKVTIDAAVGSSDIRQTHKVSQGGINVGIGGAVADAANSAIYSVQRRVALTNPWIIDAEAGGISQYDPYRLANGSWDWPTNNGALPGTTTNYQMQVGESVDRIGGTYGAYLSPEGTPLSQRALAPGSFSSPYNQYVVIKPFEVEKSVIAPAFGEAGDGIQYKTLEVEPGKKVNVHYLIDNGYLGEKK